MSFGKNAPETKFFEPLPVVGYGVAVGHAMAGNGQQAIRAAVKSTNGLCATAGAIVGSIGGPLGTMAGAAVGATVGGLAEAGMKYFIDDPYVRNDCMDFSFQDQIVNTGFGAVGGAMGGVAGAAGAEISNMTGQVAGTLASTIFADTPNGLAYALQRRH